MVGLKKESKTKQNKAKHGKALSVLKTLTTSSWTSLILNILLAFIFIKFIFYPLLNYCLHTEMPVVAVISNSMEHDSNLDDWWQTQHLFYEKKGISLEDFKTFPFKNGFKKGDLMIIKGVDVKTIKVGDVIVFKAKKQYPIIHRVIAVHYSNNQTILETKGDHNTGQIKNFQVDETSVMPEQVIGKAVLRIPLLGWIKIWFSKL